MTAEDYAGQALIGLLAGKVEIATNKAGQQVYDSFARKRVVKLAKQIGELMAANPLPEPCPCPCPDTTTEAAQTPTE